MLRLKPKFKLAFPIWLAVCLIGLLAAASQADWLPLGNQDGDRHIVAHLGQGGYLVYETLQSVQAALEERGLGSSDVSPFLDFLARKARANRSVAPSASSAGRPKHVIYLQMESVDALSIRARYQGEPLMPFLYQLRGQALDFLNTVDATSAGRTTDGEFLALASLPPVFGKPVYVNYDLSRVPSLPRALNAAGYYTFSMHGYNGVFWSRAKAHRELGYQDSFFEDDLEGTDRIGWGISDYSVLQQAADKILASDKPVFAHIILLTNHHPYHYVGRLRGMEKETIIENHIDSLRYVDESIAAFFERLRADGLLDDCLIALYSDHDSSMGQSLREIVQLEQSSLFQDSVPLLLLGSQRPPALIEKVSSLQDLPVIVLNELGIELPFTFSGNSIESELPSLTPRGIALYQYEDQLHGDPAPVDVTKLTKLAILHPERLEQTP